MDISFVDLIKAVAPAMAIYVAVRVDLAVLKVRVDHLEKHVEKVAA